MKKLIFQNGTPADATTVCDDCEKWLDESFNYCPFCGDEL